ncbi:Bro1 protein [Saccharomycopsis crataegensis]|uniref:BRO domain-containing protein 1 n=1 Tax=Saccharomycopsis crataegensis TaxID=43959 RepID=A0AAV5QST4_9ASCO|nr:Bro1 protein [Saccharomycopsis crataegensis]
MKQLPMLRIPLKETESVDWEQAIKQYLLTVYGSWNDFSEETAEFNKLREEMSGCNQDSVGLGFYLRYYTELELLEMRISPKEGGGVHAQFNWSDSFNKSAKVSQHSIAFEKASVLFNLGALFSVIADNQYNDHETDEDVENSTQNFKNALSNYQNAAGVFQFVSENFLHAPSNDMNQTTVKFLAKLMLAQAQEVFALNLVINQPDNGKYSLLAKLFQSAANLYKASHELLSTLISDNIWFTSHQNWSNIVKIKRHYFEALANYYQSLVFSNSNKFGEAIGYMKSCSDSLNDAKAVPLTAFSSSDDTKQNFVQLVKAESIKDLVEKVAKELVALERDNDYIYHDSIPQKFNLNAIKAMDAVRPTKLESIFSSPTIKYKSAKNLFQRIVPLKVHEYNSIYSEEKAKRLRTLDEKIEVSNESVNSFCEYWNLPKSVNDIKAIIKDDDSGGALDFDGEFKEFYKHKLKPLSKEIQMESEINFQNFQKERMNSLDIISRCEGLLRSDEQKYNENKLKYGASWSQTDSLLASMEIKNDLIKVKRNLIQTESSDRQMAESFAKIEPLYKLLRNASAFKKELRDYFFTNSSSADKAASLLDLNSNSLLDIDDQSSSDARDLIGTIEADLSALAHLQKEMGLMFSEYKLTIHEDDISDVLVMNKDMPENQIKEVLFAKELEKFEHYELRIEKIIQKRNSIMNSIKVNIGALNSNSTVKDKKQEFSKKQGKKLQMYETLKDFESRYRAVNTGVSNGIKFYDELKRFLNQLESQATSFVSARNEESRKLQGFSSAPKSSSDDLNERLARLNLSTSTAGPPTTTTTSNNIYSSDIANQNRYSSVSSTSWSQSPLIPKKSSISMSTPESSYYQQNLPLPQDIKQQYTPHSLSQQPSSNQSLSMLYGSYSSQPPALPPKQAPSRYEQAPSRYEQAPPLPSQPVSYQQSQQQDNSGMQNSQAGIPFYNSPSNYDSNMYSMFSDQNK